MQKVCWEVLNHLGKAEGSPRDPPHQTTDPLLLPSLSPLLRSPSPDPLGVAHDPLLEVAVELERIALSDDYFKSRSLYPNVDFYSGIVLRAIGIPVDMFTVLFAVARTTGWVAQWKEMAEEPVPRIVRPRQIYLGAMHQGFVPEEMRNKGHGFQVCGSSEEKNRVLSLSIHGSLLPVRSRASGMRLAGGRGGPQDVQAQEGGGCEPSVNTWYETADSCCEPSMQAAEGAYAKYVNAELMNHH